MKFKLFIIYLILFSFSAAHAQPKETLDFKLDFGQHEFTIPYFFAGDKIPYDGYLLTVADLALFKVEFDSFEDTLNYNLDFLKKECDLKIIRCQEDSNKRFVQINQQNDALKKELQLQVQLYKDQKSKTFLYSLSAAFATGLVSYLIIQVRN